MKKASLIALGLIVVLSLSACSSQLPKQQLIQLGDSNMPNMFNTATNSQIAVATTSTQILPLNGIRQYASICNNSTRIIYLNLGSTSSVNIGIPLQASSTVNSCFEINNTKNFTGPIYGITIGANGTTSSVSVVEK